MKLASRSYSVLALMVVAVSVLFEVTVANPLPQSEDDYGDFDVSKLDRQAKLEDDTADADLVEGADPIGDIFGDLLKGAGALLTEGIKIVTDVTDGSVSSKNVTETLGDVLKVGTDATEEVAKIGVKAIGAAPSILEQKIAFAQGFGKTVEETSGQVKQGAQDINQQFKVAAAFAKTYGEFAIEEFSAFLQTFARRLRCNTECQKFKEGSEKRQQCEIENCIELAQLKTAEEVADEYDYSYGYEDTEEENEVIEVSPRTKTE